MTIDPNRREGNGSNLLINPDFQVSQRGVYTTATTVTDLTYYLDRWKVGISVISGTLQLISNNICRLVATSTASGSLVIGQMCERVQPLVGKTVVARVLMRTNNANCRLGCFNGSSWVAMSTPHSGSGLWEYLTISFPYSAAETRIYIGAMSSSGATVSITSGDYIEIMEPKLELGSYPTPFSPRLYAEELALCQRYYYRHQGSSNPQYTSAINFLTNSTSLDFIFPLPVPMRIPPVISIGGTRGSAWTLKDSANNINTSGTFVSVGRSSTVPEFDFGTGSFTTTTRYYIKLETSSGYIDASAEL